MIDEVEINMLEAMCRARGAVVVEVPAGMLARLLSELRARRSDEPNGGEESIGGDV